MTGVMEPCDKKGMQHCDDNGLEHCDDKVKEHCADNCMGNGDDKGHGEF